MSSESGAGVAAVKGPVWTPHCNVSNSGSLVSAREDSEVSEGDESEVRFAEGCTTNYIWCCEHVRELTLGVSTEAAVVGGSTLRSECWSGICDGRVVL